MFPFDVGHNLFCDDMLYNLLLCDLINSPSYDGDDEIGFPRV